MAALCLALANCGKTGGVDPKYGVAASPRVISDGRPIPKGGGRKQVGKPYTIAGRTYVPRENPNYSATGIASWYGSDFHGRKTANGEIYDMNALSAAHPTLPLPSYVRVTNLKNKRSLVVRVNDRGPFHANRVIALSRQAAHTLGLHQRGLAQVKVDYVGPASLGGSDDRKLMATLRNGTPAPAPRTMVADARSVPAPEPRPEANRQTQDAQRSRETQVASAQPFMREYFDPKPMSRPAAATRQTAPSSRSADAARAPLPTRAAEPPQRRAQQPYQLASSESRAAPAPTASETGPRMVWNQGPQPVSFNSRFGAAPRPQPISQGSAAAYAPVRYDGVMNGRGLY